VGLLDATGGGGGLASRLGGELLAGGLASGGLAGGLFGTCHRAADNEPSYGLHRILYFKKRNARGYGPGPGENFSSSRKKMFQKKDHKSKLQFKPKKMFQKKDHKSKHGPYS